MVKEWHNLVGLFWPSLRMFQLRSMQKCRWILRLPELWSGAATEDPFLVSMKQQMIKENGSRIMEEVWVLVSAGRTKPPENTQWLFTDTTIPASTCSHSVTVQHTAKALNSILYLYRTFKSFCWHLEQDALATLQSIKQRISFIWHFLLLLNELQQQYTRHSPNAKLILWDILCCWTILLLGQSVVLGQKQEGWILAIQIKRRLDRNIIFLEVKQL